MSRTKDKAKRFLRHLLHSDKPPEHDPHAADSLAQSFGSLAVSDSPQYPPDSAFVGGFHPGYIPTDNPQPQKTPSNTASPPPAMPVPWGPPSGRYSMTMQMALQPQGYHPPLSHRPLSLPAVPSPIPPPPDTTSISVPTTPLNTSSSEPPATPTKFNISHTSSAVSAQTSLSQAAAVSQQCAGVTKLGKRCTRRVKSGPALSRALESEESPGSGNPPIERFCFQHTKELLRPSGYYARKNGVWVDFTDWIPCYLQPETQVALRVEMEKARSLSDVHGYIYTFEIRDPSVSEIKLKVGRAVNLVRRIDQWGKQCGSKEQVLRGWYPGTVELEDSGGSLMKGRVKAGDKAPWCHRMERLIHLELADLVATGIYLDPAWPHPAQTNGRTGSDVKKSELCADCGTLHKEIFPFKRLKGHRKGKEWELVVQPVIERWGNFVAQFA